MANVPVRDETTLDNKGATLALTLLRVAVGSIFLVHGAMKLADTAGTTAAFTSMGVPVPGLAIYVAILAEFLGGLGLLLGLFTRIAAIGPLVVMAGAIAFVHWGNGLFAQNGGWEYPLTLAVVSLYFVARGAGPLSVDALLRERQHRRARRRLEPSRDPRRSGGEPSPSYRHPAGGSVGS